MAAAHPPTRVRWKIRIRALDYAARVVFPAGALWLLISDGAAPAVHRQQLLSERYTR